MSIRSMTGFAATSLALTLDDGNKVNLTFSLKSFNSRFFEATCRLPLPLTNLEHEFNKLFKRQLFRGHIYFTIYMSNPSAFKGSIQPALPIIQGYLNAEDIVKKKFDLEGSLSINQLFQLPNIFDVVEKGIDDKTKKAITKTLQKLIDQLISTQEKEGKELKKDIDQRIKIMKKEMNAIEKASKKLIKEQKEKVSNILKELQSDPSQMAEMQKNSLYAFLDKIDIHEEIVRFKSHLQNLHDLLDAPGIEKGKRLDFTLQELGREINTIAAKCSDATIGSLAIDVKVELEKAREQSQNIV